MGVSSLASLPIIRAKSGPPGHSARGWDADGPALETIPDKASILSGLATEDVQGQVVRGRDLPGGADRRLRAAACRALTDLGTGVEAGSGGLADHG